MIWSADENRYQKMTYNRSGRSGLKLPAVSLGLWHNFGGKSRLDNTSEIVRSAFDMGITHFDLANNYGPPPGSAEENFGIIMGKDLKPYRDELVISTKAGYLMWPGPYGEFGSRKYMLSSLDQSLKRMKLDYVDIFYSHRPDPDTPIEETMGALDTAVRQGKALYAGISNYYTQEQAKAAFEALRYLGTPCIIHQTRYNVIDRRIEDNNLHELHKSYGVGCIVFSPLEQGILTSRYLKGIPEDSRAATPSGFLKSDHVEKHYDFIKKINAIAAGRGQSLAEMALAWCLRDPAVTSVLIGASSVEQLKENVKVLDSKPFTDEELAAIDDLALSVKS
jgi:L-glyceraldehyde 3-phosphate reductase